MTNQTPCQSNADNLGLRVAFSLANSQAVPEPQSQARAPPPGTGTTFATLSAILQEALDILDEVDLEMDFGGDEGGGEVVSEGALSMDDAPQSDLSKLREKAEH